MTLPRQQRNDLEAIVGRWREALAAWHLTGSDRDRDAAILRFEQAYEVALKFVGIRPGEKLHEQMIGSEDSAYTYEYPNHFKILPAINSWDKDGFRIKDGKRVEEGFSYTSDNNQEWMSQEELKSWIHSNENKIGKI